MTHCCCCRTAYGRDMYIYEQQQYNKSPDPPASSGAGMKAVKEPTGDVQSQQSGKTIRPVRIYFLQFLLLPVTEK